jgi:hypothetical protein
MFSVESLEKMIRSPQIDPFRKLPIIFITKSKGHVLVASKRVHLFASEEHRRRNESLSHIVISVSTVTVGDFII